VLVEDCAAHDNNGRGLQIDGGCEDLLLRRVTLNHNGCAGGLVARATRLRLEDCETSFNNWRGVWAGYYRRSPCGIKVWRSRDVVLVAHRALRNGATGIWIDEDNRRVRIERAHVLGNRRGIHVEASPGPVTIEGCSVVGNRQEPLPGADRWAFGSGIAITHARDVTVRDCVLAGNDVAQLGVRDDRETRRLKLDDGPPQELHTAGLRLQRNTVVADAHGDWLRVPDAAFDGGRCLDSLRSDGNRFVGAARAGAVLVASHQDAPARPRRLTLAQWQALSGQDRGSTCDGQAD
jgi:hypothetical protein